MSDLEELKDRLRQCLTELKGKSKTVSALNSSYHEKYGIFIPYAKYGFITLRAFLESIPDVVQVTQGGTSLDGLKLTAVGPGKKQVVPVTEKTTTGAIKKTFNGTQSKQVKTAFLQQDSQLADSSSGDYNAHRRQRQHRYSDLNLALMPDVSETNRGVNENYTQQLTVADLILSMELMGLTGGEVSCLDPICGMPVEAHDPSIQPLNNVEQEDLLNKQEGEKKNEEEQAGPVPVDPAMVLPPFEHKNIAPTANQLYAGRNKQYRYLIGPGSDVYNLLGCNFCRDTDVSDPCCPKCGRFLLKVCDSLPTYEAVSHTSSAQASGSRTTTDRSAVEVEQASGSSTTVIGSAERSSGIWQPDDRYQVTRALNTPLVAARQLTGQQSVQQASGSSTEVIRSEEEKSE